jgi:tRNA modification GTPase
MADTSTIAALATSHAPAGIAVIRVSGPLTTKVLDLIFKGKVKPAKNPRKLIYGDLLDFESKEIIDRALAVFMPNPSSFTGEDVAEFQFHGSPFLVQKILRSLYACGITPAEPGEFSKRAFLNGKIDLTQAEAIADIINATSEHALKLASEQMHGRLSSAIKNIGEPLRNSLAEIEAHIDFPEEDINPQTKDHISAAVNAAMTKIDGLLMTYSYGQKVKEGFRVLLCGAPNTGKSSLLNLILGRDRVLVSEISGTTRDLIEEEVQLSNYRFIFCDSAGIRETTDVVEKMGIELALDRIPWADLVILVTDARDENQEWQKILTYLRGNSKKIWLLVNKIDLNQKAIGKIYCDSSVCQQNFYVSVKTQAGIDNFIRALIDEVKNSSYSEASQTITNERHRLCLENAKSALQTAVLNLSAPMDYAIISADIRNALNELQEIIGVTYNEDILGRIFSKFCIGK